MSRFSPLLTLSLCLTLLVAGTSAVHAATPLKGVPAFNQTADALLAVIDPHYRGTPPPPNDPRVRAFLAKTHDKAILGDGDLSDADGTELSALCQKASDIQTGYVNATVGLLDGSNGSQTAARETHRRLVDLLNHNAMVYQDVIVPLTIFDLRCAARLLAASNDEAALDRLPAEEKTPDAMISLTETRRAFQVLAVSAIGMLGQKGVSLENRESALAAVAETSASFAPTLTLPERKAVVVAATTARTSATTAQVAKLDQVIATFSDTRCRGLCRLGE